MNPETYPCPHGCNTERDELAREMFIADNANQSREQAIIDWQWFEDIDRGDIEHYKTMAAGILAAGYGKLADAWDEGYMRGQFPWKKEAQEVDPIPDYLRPPSTGRNTNPYRSES